MEYYLNDHDWVFAIDKQGNKWQYNWKEKKFVLAVHFRPYWGGCTEEYAKKRMKELENGINVL